MSLLIHIASFGYRKSGIPADESGHGGGYVFDCRGLPNPGREERFQALTGLDAEVELFLAAEEAVEDFLAHCLALCLSTAEAHRRRDFTQLSVSFGCTGGQHRSVYCAERTAQALRDAGYDVVVTHNEREHWP
ncbi:MAG: ATP-binding protein [Bacteroidia bacterium]|nr:ATP-binding protein [Bacteroidia bacterium]